MKPIVIISTTLDRKADAERIGRLLLDRKLIACAQISGPITSLYRWQGVTETATEFSLSIKTSPACVREVRQLLGREHPYELPEIIEQELVNSSEEYSRWVHGEVQE